MKNRRHLTLAACTAACMLAFAATAALAQSSAPADAAAPRASAASTPADAAAPRASAASTPAAVAPIGPRLRSPAETGNRATAPGDLRPERPVTPQISIPFGKKPPPPPKGEAGAPKRGNTAAPNSTVNDAAARCESQVDEAVRAACLAKLEREAKGRPVN